MRAALSSTSASNELMRRCLLRWQSERHAPALRSLWRHLPTFSFNPRFLRVLASDYSQRRYGSGVQNFSDVPGKPALRLIPAVLPLWRRRKVILWSLLRQGPRRTRLSPWHAMGPRLDTRSLRIGLRRVESKNTNCRDEPHPVEQNAKASLGDRGRN